MTLSMQTPFGHITVPKGFRASSVAFALTFRDESSAKCRDSWLRFGRYDAQRILDDGRH